jgi:hypothetical protein
MTLVLIASDKEKDYFKKMRTSKLAGSWCFTFGFWGEEL